MVGFVMRIATLQLQAGSYARAPLSSCSFHSLLIRPSEANDRRATPCSVAGDSMVRFTGYYERSMP
jgi:hypothetical protein